MKVLNIQQIEALVFNPAFFHEHLAFRAMPVPTGIVGWTLVSALRAFIHVAAQSRRPAKLYCPEIFLLLVSHGMTAFICISIFAKYILYFWHADTSLRAVSGTLGPVNTGLGNMEICISR